MVICDFSYIAPKCFSIYLPPENISERMQSVHG